MADYSGALLKVERAEVHISELDFLLFTYLRRRPYCIVQKMDFETEEFGFEITLTERPPATAALLLGDALHNLRAALDHTISAIAAAGGHPIEKTFFPFASSSATIEQAIKKGVALAGEEAMNICRGLSPYPGGNDALWGLHAADIADKHRAIIPGAAYGNFQFRLLPNSNQQGVGIEVPIHPLGDEPYFVPGINGREHETPSEIGLSLDVIFPTNGPLGGYPMVATLFELRRLVLEAIGEFQKRIQ
jgi:hypothetical protein